MVELRAVRSGTELLVYVSREYADRAGRFHFGEYPGWVEGTWILTRTIADGKAVRICYFPRTDPNVYLQLTPFAGDSGKTSAILIAYDAILAQGKTIPLSMDRLMTEKMDTVFALLGPSFPLRYTDPPPAAAYSDAQNLMRQIRARLPAMAFVDDGAQNEYGEFVYIRDGSRQVTPPPPLEKDHPYLGVTGGYNCSGFVKWIGDGLIYPLTGNYMQVAPLKAPFGDRGNSFTDPYEAMRDPWFGLDWTRNIASRLNAAYYSDDFASVANWEVRKAPFNRILARNSSGQTAQTAFPEYLKDAGFLTNGLKALLYTLAIDKPGQVYLASANNEVHAPTTKENPRGLPWMRQHHHVALLVPYFNEYGNFQVAVFESAAETTYKAFVSRYQNGNCENLVGIPTAGGFVPM
jgi:hypothetical protein